MDDGGDLPGDLPHWPLQECRERFSASHHGDFPRWQAAIDTLPPIEKLHFHADDTVWLAGTSDTAALTACLEVLHPWRKGPFRFGDVLIDTEWRSDWKWARLQRGLGSLSGHRVLDIGCGNGYFGWRMLAAGAVEVIGVDPTVLFCMQHRAVQRYLAAPRHWVLPLRVEELPWESAFDTVFSMGVIYHRRDPQDHVAHLHSLTRAGGQCVLESLITTRPTGFRPADRYARMRNVWYLPTIAELTGWMAAAGFSDVRCIDVSPTTVAEQRTTSWMRFESLAEALDPEDPSRTLEGLEAPVRAAIVGNR